MNETIDLLQKHVSVRQFSDKKMSEAQVKELILSAQAASSSSFLQAYSIIGIEEEELKRKIARLAGNQPFIAEGSHFFIFCADMQRLNKLAKKRNVDIQLTLEGIDATLVGTVDASLAAQNMTIAAESMGMGVCYIGGIRDTIVEISEMLELPEYVFPIFGLVIGYPKVRNDLKPRMPITGIYHVNKYNNETDRVVDEYEEQTKNYYAHRTGGAKKHSWAESVLSSLKRLPRTETKPFLNQQGMAKK